LYLQESFNCVRLFDRWNFDSDLDLSSLFLSDFESNFLKIFKSLIAANREDILIQIVELGIVAASDDSQHVRVGAIVFYDFVLQADRDIKLFNGAGEESRFAEHDVGPIYLNEVFSLR